MMADRYSRSKQRSWFVPTLVVLGIAAYFFWESGWRPFEVLDVPTGTIAGEPQSGPDSGIADTSADLDREQFEPDVASLDDDELLHEFNLQTAQHELEFGSEPPTSRDPVKTGDPEITQAAFSPGASPFDDPGATTLENTDSENVVSANSKVVQPTAELRMKLNKIDLLLDENDYLTAHRDLSMIYWYEPQYRALIEKRLAHTSASIYAAPQPHYMSAYVVQANDTLGEIADKYRVPWTYLARLNNVAPERLRAGTRLKVNKGPFGAVVDLSDFRLTIHAHGYYVRHYAIGIGKAQSTPIGDYTVTTKLENPTYYPPEGGEVASDDPANPLGEYWLGIGDGYGIHGTIDESSVGRAESRGCIRLRNQDIAEVFDLLTPGSAVRVRR